VSACGFVGFGTHALGGWRRVWSLWVVEVFGVGEYMHMCVFVGVLAANDCSGVCSPHGSLLGAGRRS